MKQNDNSKTETLAQLVTSITFLSFIFGVTNLTVHYFYFSFNVFEYIELSEIITHSIRDAVYIFTLLLLIVYSAFFYTVYFSSQKKLWLSNFISKISNSNKFKAISRYSEFFIVILLIIWCTLEYFFKSFSMYNSIGTGVIVSLLLMTMLMRSSVFLKSSYNYEISKKITVLGFASIFTIMGSWISSVYNLQQTLLERNQGGSYIIINRDTIKSNMNHYYIGRTKGYVFFYNNNTKTTDVYPDKDISKLQIR